MVYSDNTIGVAGSIAKSFGDSVDIQITDIQITESPMEDLGMKDNFAEKENLIALRITGGRPTSFPREEVVYCGYNQGLGERLFICRNIQAMQELYDAYARGGAIGIRWYTKKS